MELPMESVDPTGPGEGAINKVGPMSQPCSIIDTASRTMICTNTQVRSPNQLYSRQLRVTCTLIYRGAVSHQANKRKICRLINRYTKQLYSPVTSSQTCLI